MRFRNGTIGPTAFVLLAAFATLPAQTPPAPPAAPTRPARPNFLISRTIPDAAAVERGSTLFVASCGFCHGSKANGGENGPDLIRSPLALNDEGGDKIGPVILKGRPDKGMPPFSMSETQIADIAAFLRARQQAAINRNAYAIQNIVTGDSKKGESYFNGAGKCNTCHSPSGDLQGIGAKFDPVALQSRFLYPETRAFGRRRAPGSAPKLTPVTVTLPNGDTISGGLEYLDDFNVGLRDSSGGYRSFARTEGLKVDVRDPLAAHARLLQQYTDADMHNLLAYLVTLK
jgi:cytochrome c oxidase cbb3-type subunit 3